MKTSNLQVLGLLLIVLLVTQELHARATFIKDHHKRNRKNAPVAAVRPVRERRSVVAVLFGVALFASMANIGFDIYLQIEGCCGLFPIACDYQEMFNETKAAILETSAKIDTEWTKTQNLLTYVQSSSARNGEIALAIKRITQVYENIVETVDPEVINNYNEISEQLKQAVEEKNSTVLGWTNAEVDAAFHSVFDTSLGKLQILSGVIGQAAGFTLSYVWNWYQTAKIQTMLKTSYGSQLTNVQNAKALKVLGSTDADAFISQTAVARRQADVANSWGSTAMTIAGGVMAVVQIGVEIWMAVLKVKQCEATKNSIRDAYLEIQPEEAKMNDLYADILDNYDNMTETWDFITEQISDDDFLGYLGEIKNLSSYASVTTTELTDASTVIQTFIDSIGTAQTEKEVYDLQGDLITALDSVTFTLDCYYKKVKTMQVVEDRCISGTDTLENIYSTAVAEFDTNSDDCTYNASITYTTLAAVQEYITGRAETEDFDADCPLNSPTTQDLVCTKKCAGTTGAGIATEVGISSEYVTKFLAMCPTTCPLADADKDRICMFKGFGMTEEMIVSAYPKNDPDEVRTVYNSC